MVQTLEAAVTRSGQRLMAMCEVSPVLLVFLRHAGCTFCREAMSDVARARDSIETRGIRIILVHMGDAEGIDRMIARYGLTGVDCICDAEQKLYRAFGLKRGRAAQLFGWKVLRRALPALARHGIGSAKADGLQMPGLFLVDGLQIVRRFRHRSAADRPDYAALCGGLG